LKANKNVVQLRAERKVDLEKHVEEVNRLVAQANGDLDASLGMADSSDDDEEEFTGFAEPEPVNQEDEYIDEDKYTTVTVESVNISKAGLSRPGEDTAEEAAAQKHKEEKEAEAAQSKKRVWTKEWPKNNDRPKKKKIKFRYETKLERKANRVKEGIKKRKQKEARTKDT
jgi:ribosomal RNA-processing protein 17